MSNDEYLEVLRRELVPALGCTEPIAVALAAARARRILGREPETAEITCSGNVVKNVKGVTVPRTGGMKGIEAAAIAGFVAGNPDAGLQVLESVEEKDFPRIRAHIASHMCGTKLALGVEPFHSGRSQGRRGRGRGKNFRFAHEYFLHGAERTNDIGRAGRAGRGGCARYCGCA
ncbi:MAG: hypothetical protein WBH97_02020 [Rectinemataceae bacterium]